MKMTLSDRTKLLLKELEVDQVGLAKIACITKGAVNQWISSKPSATMKPAAAFSIADKKGYNPRWLILGEGPIKSDKTYQPLMVREKDVIPYKKTDDGITQEIITIARSIDDVGRGMLLSKARDIADERAAKNKANTA